jgi:hypothetical protein
MQDIFSPMLSCVLKGNIFSVSKKYVQFCVQTFYENIFPVFVAELCATMTIHDTMIGKNIQCLPRKQKIGSCKMFAHKAGHIFFSKTLNIFSLRMLEKHWRNISCIRSVDTANFLAPYFCSCFCHKQSRRTPLFFTKIHAITIKVEFP